MSKQVKQFYEFGPFRLDPSQRVLFRDSKPVSLPPKILETLLVLVERNGQIVEKEKLLEEVWPETFVEENNLTQYISTLRKTLGEGRHDPRYIETIPRRGYRFAAEVRQVRDEAAEWIIRDQTTVSLKISEETEETEQEQTTQGTAAVGFFRHRKLPQTIAVVSTLVVAITAVIFWVGVNKKPADTGIGQTPFRGSIAVLPFKALDPSEREEYLGLGMADTLITKLSNIGQIKVRPTSAVRKYAGQEQDALAAGREQKVDAVLEGSIQRSGDKMRVTVRLLNVADGSPLWAYKCDIDPNYALGYAGLADSYFFLGAPTKRDEALGKALELDDRLVEALTTQAYVDGVSWDWSGAEILFKRAIELNPNYPPAHHWYAYHLAAMARFAEAIEEINRAKELDPLSLIINTDVGQILYFSRQYDQAIEAYRRALDLDPNFAVARWRLGESYDQKGMYEEAIAEFQKAISFSKNLSIEARLGHAYAVSGKEDEARKIIGQLKKELKRSPVWSYEIAMIYEGLGEKDQAFEWLEKAYENKTQNLALLKVEPMLDGLRSDPRFGKLLNRIGLSD